MSACFARRVLWFYHNAVDAQPYGLKPDGAQERTALTGGGTARRTDALFFAVEDAHELMLGASGESAQHSTSKRRVSFESSSSGMACCPCHRAERSLIIWSVGWRRSLKTVRCYAQHGERVYGNGCGVRQEPICVQVPLLNLPQLPVSNRGVWRRTWSTLVLHMHGLPKARMSIANKMYRGWERALVDSQTCVGDQLVPVRGQAHGMGT
ncbi:MAG: hypothetical protein ACI9W2_005377 [Gammaproteobacteria bacterium]|jgi:hypothetical protein